MELKPIDIEDGLQKAINLEGINAGCIPLRGDFENHLPYVLIQRVGGSSKGIIDTHALSVDSYAKTWKQAMNTAASTIKIIRGLQGKIVEQSQCYTVHVSNAYNNPDPKNTEVPRVTFSAQITTRGVE